MGWYSCSQRRGLDLCSSMRYFFPSLCQDENKRWANKFSKLDEYVIQNKARIKTAQAIWVGMICKLPFLWQVSIMTTKIKHPQKRKTIRTNKQTNKQKRPILILGVTFLLTDKEEYSMYCRMFSTVRLFWRTETCREGTRRWSCCNKWTPERKP